MPGQEPERKVWLKRGGLALLVGLAAATVAALRLTLGRKSETPSPVQATRPPVVNPAPQRPAEVAAKNDPPTVTPEIGLGGIGTIGKGAGGGGTGYGRGVGAGGSKKGGVSWPAKGAPKGSGKGPTKVATAAPHPPPAAEPPPAPPPDFDTIEQGFRTAQASYVIPEAMMMGDSAHVHLDLSLQKTVDELRDDLQKHLPDAKVVTATLKTSSIAQARLTGQHFQITAITPEEQPVGSRTTSWEWEVTATSGGKRPLHLSIDAVVSIGAQTRRWTINTFERTVMVRVSTSARIKEFATGNWQWLWATVVAPVGGWFWVKRKAGKGARRRRRPAPPTASQV